MIRVQVWRNFLSEAECAHIRELSEPRLTRSPVVNRQGGSEISSVRTSSGGWIGHGEFPIVQNIYSRIGVKTGRNPDTFEALQILKYEPGQQYEPHYDWFDPKDASSKQDLSRGGQRTGTVLMYLKSPAQGGKTIFPQAGIEVEARQGYALYFEYDLNSLSLHGGAPVIEGEKWVATVWMRESKFN